MLNPGGSATVVARSYDGIPSRRNLKLPAVTSPAWLQIVRYQDTRYNPAVTLFATLTSTDGTNWTPVLGSTRAIDMGNGAYLAGMVASAGAAGVNPPAVFNSVALSAVTVPPSNICPEEFTCEDIGIDILPGDQTYLDTPNPATWTFNAGGSDMWGVFDSFRFAHAAFPFDPDNSPNGDGTISARVVSQVNARWRVDEVGRHDPGWDRSPSSVLRRLRDAWARRRRAVPWCTSRTDQPGAWSGDRRSVVGDGVALHRHGAPRRLLQRVHVDGRAQLHVRSALQRGARPAGSTRGWARYRLV